MDIDRSQDLGRLVEGDPIRRSRHRGQSDAAALPASVAFGLGEVGASADPLSVTGLEPPPEVPSDVDFEVPGEAVALRSFFAQPDPL
jgi:hypothetical protein